MAIEVEKKAIVEEADLERIREALTKMGAEDLGKNDTESYFYLHDDYQLKVQIQLSKGAAKIAWKSGGFNGASAREEIELPFPVEQGKNAHKLMDRLLPELKKVRTLQKRHDLKLGDIEIALKWSEQWKFHIELDTNVEDEAGTQNALQELEGLAQKLDIHLMTEAEEKALTDAILKTL